MSPSEQYHLALGEFFRGKPVRARGLYSHRADATLANPFGPIAKGWEKIAETTQRAAAQLQGRSGDRLRDGSAMWHCRTGVSS
jgi:hypothetical protein